MKFGPSIPKKKYVRILTLLAGIQVRPILLSALIKLDQHKIERLLYWLVTLIVRYQTVGGGRTGRLEQHCTSVAPRVFSGELKSPQAIWEQLKTIVPKDDEFINDFSVYSETSASKSRYILAQLEQVSWTTKNPDKGIEKTPSNDPSVLNLEHILPKNPSGDWKVIVAADKALLQDNINNIGNLCLLSSKSNKALEAKSFQAKAKEVYRKSELITTKELAEKYDSWDRKSIESRGKELAALAVKAWPIE